VAYSKYTNEISVSYVLLPFIFLTVALLGGLRVIGDDRALFFSAATDYTRSRRPAHAAI
jgi:hypothetical protein